MMRMLGELLPVDNSLSVDNNVTTNINVNEEHNDSSKI